MINRDWIKDNFSLILGIFLPIILVVLFVVAQVSGRVIVDPPRYDILLSAYDYNTQSRPGVYFRINGKKIQMLKHTGTYNPGPHRILRYHVKTQELEDITPAYPENLSELKADAVIDTPLLNRLTLNVNSTSPDGYTFDQYGYNSRGGLLGSICFSSASDYGPRISKGSSVVKIRPLLNSTYGGTENFLAWIISEE